MGAVTRIISLGSLMVFGFIKGFQSIAHVLSAIITVFMYLSLYKQLNKEQSNITDVIDTKADLN